MNQRTERMAVIIRKTLGSAVLELLPQSHVTIVRVDVSPDLRHATVWVSSMLEDAELIAKLNTQKVEFANHLTKALATKFTPKLQFREDWGTKRTQDINSLLKHI